MYLRIREDFSFTERRAFYADLDHLAGTWSAEDAAEFERNTAAFESVDEEMWK